jgi:3',5'-cyclic AMP phosphodiesterase CpdA
MTSITIPQCLRDLLRASTLAIVFCLMTSYSATGSAAEILIAAAGDIACDPDAAIETGKCKDDETAQLIKTRSPALVLALGDLQYVNGSLKDFQRADDLTWGQFKDITRPAVGNHEYLSGNAQAYFDYFGAWSGGNLGYYAFDLNGWRLYAINSECDRVNCTPQRDWLKADIRSHPRACQLMFMHRPLYSSGGHASAYPKPFWTVGYRNKFELVLAGHEHRYERFAPMDPYGNTNANGIRSFIVGTGGKDLFGTGIAAPGSQFRYNQNYGVLFLKLGSASYTWEFQSITGSILDSGSGVCR